jgi:hypothetical protein
MDFVVRYGHMFDASGHNDEFSGFDDFVAVTKTHAQGSVDDQKHFVFVVVMVPDELALQPDDFDVRVVDLTDDFGAPEFGDLAELFFQVYGLHHLFLSVAPR